MTDPRKHNYYLRAGDGRPARRRQRRQQRGRDGLLVPGDLPQGGGYLPSWDVIDYAHAEQPDAENMPCGSRGSCWPSRRSSAWSTRPRRKRVGRERDFAHIPILDVSELVAAGPCPRAVAKCLGAACRESGFFYVVGHGVDAALQT
jgi:hypothetical protein